jgi:hypothetical protein
VVTNTLSALSLALILTNNILKVFGKRKFSRNLKIEKKSQKKTFSRANVSVLAFLPYKLNTYILFYILVF